MPDEHGPLRHGGRAGRRSRLRARPRPRVRRRSGARQRWSRPPRRLLHGLARDPGAARDRLRDPLRLRDVRAEDRRRAPGRAARQLASARQRLGAPAPRGRADGALRRARDLPPRSGRPAQGRVGRHPRGDRRALRLVHRRPPERDRQHPAALVGARDPRLRSPVLQRGGLPARGAGEDRHREHLEGPLSERPHRRGEGAAPQAAVLLRRLLDRGHHPALQAAQGARPARLRAAVRKVRGPAQRHPPRRSRSPS